MNLHNDSGNDIKHFLELSQYLTTKICHDLSGSLGALGSVVEFLSSDNQDLRAKALDLLSASSAQSINRLIFYRQAYGISRNVGESNLEDLKHSCVKYLESTKIKLSFHEKYFRLPGVFISADVGKLIMCLIHHASSNLIHGGEIEVKVIEDDHSKKSLIKIAAHGQNIKIDDEKNLILRGQLPYHLLSTKNVTAFFTYHLAKFLNISISISTTGDSAVEYDILL